VRTIVEPSYNVWVIAVNVENGEIAIELECVAAVQQQLPHAPRHPTLPPKSLVLPGKAARGGAHDLLRIGNCGADALRHAAVLPQDRKRALGVGGVDHVAEADAHVEDLEHLGIIDLGMALDEAKDRVRVNQRVEQITAAKHPQLNKTFLGSTRVRVVHRSP
jgi:hypothetical protein